MDYVGSGQHKSYPSPAGSPGLVSDKSECPPSIAYHDAVETLKQGIQLALDEGRLSQLRDGDLPRYLWGRSTFQSRNGTPVEVVWEARVLNQGSGTYKAYPVTRTRHSQHMPELVREYPWPQ